MSDKSKPTETNLPPMDEAEEQKQGASENVKLSRRSKISRRGALKILAGVGASAAVVAWGIGQTRIGWQIGEFMALASLGAKVQSANTATFAGTEVSVAFGDHPQQYAIVILPPDTTPRRNSIVYFVHGGGWEMGNPSMYRFIGRFFARLGFPTILGGYRLTTAYRFPTQLEDTAAGLRAGMNYFANQGVGFKHIFLSGHSAGTQLASLLAYDQTIMQAERPSFLGLIAMSGPLDFSMCQTGGIRRILDAYVGHLPNTEVADPIFHADPHLPISVLLLHGAKDPVVSAENSRSFARKLNQDPIQKAELHILPNRFHSDVMNLFLEASVETKLLNEWLTQIDSATQLRGS